MTEHSAVSAHADGPTTSSVILPQQKKKKKGLGDSVYTGILFLRRAVLCALISSQSCLQSRPINQLAILIQWTIKYPFIFLMLLKKKRKRKGGKKSRNGVNQREGSGSDAPGNDMIPWLIGIISVVTVLYDEYG